MAQWKEAWNETQSSPLLERVRWCASFLCRLRGLTFRRTLGPDEGILLVGNRQNRVDAAIHMIFVFFPIAVIWLTEDHEVVDTCLARPFRPIYVPRGPAKDILEGPPRILENVERGDKLTFQERGYRGGEENEQT